MLIKREGGRMILVEPSFHIEKDLTGDQILRNIERWGRKAYKSENKITNTSHLKFAELIRNKKHWPVFERGVVAVNFICDRGISHEIVRHRLASYLQESTRYCNYSLDKFMNSITLCPMLDNLNDFQVERRRSLYKLIEKVYLNEIAEGVSPQQARDNLPTCLKTELGMQCNLVEWRHFFKMRCSPSAHPHLRKITVELLGAMKAYIPIVFNDLIIGETIL